MTDTPQDVPPGAVRRDLDGGGDDVLVREEPLLISAAGQQVLTMRTPGADEDLAVGFLLSEGVIDDARAVRALRPVPGDRAALRADAIEVELAVPADARVRGRLTRTHEIRSSCGVCGMVDADALLEELPPLLPGVPRLPRSSVPRLAAHARSLQPLFEATGACHGATLFAADGTVWGTGEDVGRHNALDKALGQAARRGHDPAHAIAVLSGRAGFDLVLKCLRLRVGVILSVSAATALSVDLCRSAGATLVGFVRGDEGKTYCDGGHLRDGGHGTGR